MRNVRHMIRVNKMLLRKIARLMKEIKKQKAINEALIKRLRAK